MIQSRTLIKFKKNKIDNSGIKVIRCIKIYGGFNKKIGYLGDHVLVSIQKVKYESKLIKGEIHPALILRSRKKKQRITGFCICFDNNGALVYNPKAMKDKDSLLGSLIIGPIANEYLYDLAKYSKGKKMKNKKNYYRQLNINVKYSY